MFHLVFYLKDTTLIWFLFYPLPFRISLHTCSPLLLTGVSVVSLDKALEVNQVSARVGDNLEIKCDVTGTPTPPIVWRRNGLDLAALNSEVR